MSNTYQEGDLVEAVKGSDLQRGILETRAGALAIGRYSFSVGYLLREGWTITVIEKAKPKVELPSEPGYYSDRHDDIWEAHENGRWLCVSDNDYSGRVTEYAPFTRLESRATTAKAVLDEVGKFAWADGFTTQIEATAKKFGVEND